MYRSQLASELPKFKDRLFENKQEALDSGLDGTVYIGSPAVHSVCTVSTHKNKESGESTKSIQFQWLRTFWDQTVIEYGYVVESGTDGCSGRLRGVFCSVQKAFEVAKEIKSDSVSITKTDLDSGEEISSYGFRWNQKPDYDRCLRELQEFHLVEQRTIKKILKELKNLQKGDINFPEHCIRMNILLVLAYLDCDDFISDFLDKGTIEFFGEINDYPIEGNSVLHSENKDKWNPETEFGFKRLNFVDGLIKFTERKVQ